MEKERKKSENTARGSHFKKKQFHVKQAAQFFANPHNGFFSSFFIFLKEKQRNIYY